MTTLIREGLGELNIVITPKMIKTFLDIVATWETKRNNPLVLHGQLIGVYKIYFLPQDRAELFHLVGLEEKEVAELIKKIPSIDQSFNVRSDPFNILSIWLIHLAESQIKNKKQRDQFKLAVAKYLHYKFFTSLIGNSFPHGADEGTMIATVLDLSAKYDIVKYGSWYKTIEERCLDMISDHFIHKKYFVTAEPDEMFLRLITDPQTRLRAKIVLIAQAYYDHHKRGQSVKTTGSTMTDAEGEKVVIEKSTTIQNVESRLGRDLLNLNAWVNPTAVREVASQFKAISPNLVKLGVTQMSAIASFQAKSKNLKERENLKGQQIIISMPLLVKMIITTSAAICTKDGIVLTNTVQAWRLLRNAFSSSRTLDPDVLLIKASMSKFVDDLGAVSRDATKTSLRMALIMYVVYRFIRQIR